ncbi:MAG: phosphatase PAP2 family protein [Bacteroidales bacterium]|nr:phosphatase PAP2 family protein [Bacteroidales bacterium]
MTADFFRQLHHIDKDITLAINSIHCPASDFIWGIFSDREIWFVLYAIVAVFLFRNLGWKRALISIAAIVLTIVCCDQLANFTKAFFERLRPCCDGEMMSRGLRQLEGCGHKIEYGFYSAHAANSMGFAVGSYLAFRNDRTRKYGIYGICIILWAVLVGLSRVFVGKHFFGDVMVGFAVGAAVAAVLSLIAGKVIKLLK